MANTRLNQVLKELGMERDDEKVEEQVSRGKSYKLVEDRDDGLVMEDVDGNRILVPWKMLDLRPVPYPTEKPIGKELRCRWRVGVKVGVD